MKNEKPVKIIKHSDRKHKVETRIYARNIHESWCVHAGCKFKGKPAVQGVCHTTNTFDGGADWSYVDNAIKQGEEYIKEIRKSHKRSGKPITEHVKWLESVVACQWSNGVYSIDELVRLRRKVSLLENKLQRTSSKSRSKNVTNT